MAFLDVSIRVALAFTFLVASVSKVCRTESWRSFLQAIEASGLTPRSMAPAVGFTVVLAEFAVASLLLVPHSAAAGLTLCILLLVVFSSVIARSVRRRDRTPCRCFGGSEEPVGMVHLYRNIILLVAAASGLAISLSHDSPPQAETLVIGIPAGVFCAFLVMFLSELHTFFRPSSSTQRTQSR
ncbi:MauE/DoxX family redox-associated membrane protein [Actinomadura fulvescens]|uniref:Methylamine utilization protein MauE n=1 Tax=Actinomadura fulvescens TaxID=46160 RepID=A0ABN3PR95_9ACTN